MKLMDWDTSCYPDDSTYSETFKSDVLFFCYDESSIQKVLDVVEPRFESQYIAIIDKGERKLYNRRFYKDSRVWQNANEIYLEIKEYAECRGKMTFEIALDLYIKDELIDFINIDDLFK